MCRLITSLALGFALSVFGSASHAFRFGVIGDSMSTAANTEDDCNDAVECLENLGTDRRFSFAHGQEPWSLHNRLKTIVPGLGIAESVAENGSRWDDAPEQAQMLMQKPDIRIVHIEMGANDVCSNTLPTIQELAEIEFYVDETLTHITDHMENGAVIISEVPDVVRVRDIHRTDQHFLFETFQDLWDLNTNKLRGQALEEICEDKFGSFVCGTLGLDDAVEYILEELLEEVIDRENAHFSCQRVLASGATALNRQQARELNQQINVLLAIKVQEYDGRNNNAFFLVDNVEEGLYTKAEISDLDGFHLGKDGQKWLADLIWDNLGPKFFLPSPTTTTTTTTSTSTTSTTSTTTSTIAATTTSTTIVSTTTVTVPVVTTTGAVTTTTAPPIVVTSTTVPSVTTTTEAATTTTAAVTTTTQAVTTTTLPPDDTDTDGDSMTDLEEGDGDEDADGIADFLDNFNLDRSQLQVDVHNPGAGTLRTNLGRLMLGDISFRSGATGARVTRQDIERLLANAVDNDVQRSCVPDCFDFDVTALFAGVTVKIVLPLSGPIPARAVYRKRINGVWSNFISNIKDGIGSAQKHGDECPLPGDDAYTTNGMTPNGLIAGNRCVQLWITDGGVNDADRAINGVISDPGGIAVPAAAGTTTPGDQDDDGSSGGGCSVHETSPRPFERGDLWLLLIVPAALRYARRGTRSRRIMRWF